MITSLQVRRDFMTQTGGVFDCKIVIKQRGLKTGSALLPDIVHKMHKVLAEMLFAM